MCSLALAHLLSMDSPWHQTPLLLQVAYSIVMRDVFVFLANFGGLLLGLYFTLVAYGLTADVQVRMRVCVINVSSRHVQSLYSS